MSKQLVKNSLLLSFARFFARGLGLISTFIVARLLSPDDYGVIAVAMIVQDFALRMQNIGFSQNLVSSKKLNDSLMTSIFYCRLVVFLSLSCLVYLISPYFALWMNSPAAGNVLSVICWIIAINGLSNLNVVLQTRKNNFLPEIKISIYSKFFSVIITATLAYYMQSYWALAIGMVSSALAQLVISYIITPAYLPKRTNLLQIKENLLFSQWFFYQNFLLFFNDKGSHFIIARYFSEKTLGLISMATSIVQMYSQEITASFDKANFSHLSKKLSETSTKDIANTIKENCLYLISVKNVLIIPVYAYCAIYSEFIIGILLGNSWIEISSIFSVLCFAAIATSYETIFRTIFNAMRQPKLYFKLSILRVICLMISMVYSVLYDDYWFIIYGTVVTNLIITLASVLLLYLQIKVNLLMQVLWLLIFTLTSTAYAKLIHYTLSSELISSFIYWLTLPMLIIIIGNKRKVVFIQDIWSFIQSKLKDIRN
jgi:O-antigen/teichoic acid export membrane protein